MKLVLVTAPLIREVISSAAWEKGGFPVAS